MKIIDSITNLIKGFSQNDQSFVISQDEINEIGSDEIIRASIKKYRKQYILVLSLIITFEI